MAQFACFCCDAPQMFTNPTSHPSEYSLDGNNCCTKGKSNNSTATEWLRAVAFGLYYHIYFFGVSRHSSRKEWQDARVSLIKKFSTRHFWRLSNQTKFCLCKQPRYIHLWTFADILESKLPVWFSEKLLFSFSTITKQAAKHDFYKTKQWMNHARGKSMRREEKRRESLIASKL